MIYIFYYDRLNLNCQGIGKKRQDYPILIYTLSFFHQRVKLSRKKTEKLTVKIKSSILKIARLSAKEIKAN